MTKEDNFTCAKFRVRLFLSVDLSGSTAFKNSMKGVELDSASPRWVTTFETFYRDFPARLNDAYTRSITLDSDTDDRPKLWKAVGDELVFCSRVKNRKSVIIALNAFIQTLEGYRKLLQDESLALDLKGAGWLATFPEPNRAVNLRNSGEASDFLTASEALESAADATPFEYDFLGKAIDTGFRIASFAKPERFVLSVQLARLLASCEPKQGFAYEIRFEETRSLKGVNGGEAYPILYVDTLNHMKTRSIREDERLFLGQSVAPDRKLLRRYLDAYCSVVGTEEICLPETAGEAECEPPQCYTDIRKKISDHLEAEKHRGKDNDVDEATDEGSNGCIPKGPGLIK